MVVRGRVRIGARRKNECAADERDERNERERATNAH